MDFTKADTVLDLANIRDSLVRMEDTIVFNLIERAQFCRSDFVYKAGNSDIPGFKGSYLDWFLQESEKVHAKLRRYAAPDEQAFFPEDLPEPILPPIDYAPILAPYSHEVSVNDEIKKIYTDDIVPLVCAGTGDQPENYGSVMVCDIETLQALSRRIHFGKFVAESKFLSETERFTELIKNRDVEGIERAITNSKVEETILARLGEKALAYGTDPTLRWSQRTQGKVDSEVVKRIYKEWVIPLTKKVEVDYLLRRLE